MNLGKVYAFDAGKQDARGRKHREIRRKFFAEYDDYTWNRKTETGFTTVPRTLALIMTLLNRLTKKNDPSRVYLELWGRAFDEMLVDVTDEEAIAYASGYTTSSNVRRWRERIKELEELGFIKTQKLGSRPYRYILILHPHKVIARLRADESIPTDWYDVYVNRCVETKADIFEEEAEPAEKKTKKKAQ